MVVVLFIPISAFATGHYQEAGTMYPEDAKEAAAEMIAEDIPIDVWTDKTEYGHNDMIIVNGQVSEVSGNPVTLIVTSPLNSVVTINSLPVFIDGSFETILNTASSLWKYDGTYTIKVSYGSAEKSNKIKVELTGGIALESDYSTSNYLKMTMDSPGVFDGAKPISLSNITMLLSYSIGATIKNISTENVEFLFHMETDDGVNKNEAWHDNLIMKPGQEHTPGFGWTPKSPGMHTITFHLWNNLDEKYDLASPVSFKVDVKGSNLGKSDSTQIYEPEPEPESQPESQPQPEPKELGIASFVDKSKDPQHYIDRYNSEPSYKKWFHESYPQYDSIEQAVGLELTQKIPEWVKNIFLFYGQDKISEDELLNAIKYLIDEGILVVN